MFCGLGEEERTKIRKKKRKKKEMNLIAAKNGLVEMKGYLKTYNRMKYFLPYFSRFWLRPFFTPNLRGDFRVPKPKSRDLLPWNSVQTYNTRRKRRSFKLFWRGIVEALAASHHKNFRVVARVLVACIVACPARLWLCNNSIQMW